MKKFALLLAFMASLLCFAGGDVSWLFNPAYYTYGTNDPSVTSTVASRGSLYFNTATNKAYVKMDDGPTTNWQILNAISSNLNPSFQGHLTMSSATGADTLWSTPGGGNIGVQTGQLSGTDYRPNNIFAKNSLSVGNVLANNPPYGLNNPALNGLILSGSTNVPNSSAFIGTTSLIHGDAQGIIGFGKDGSFSNIIAFTNSNTLSDKDMMLSLLHLGSARQDLVRFGADGTLNLQQASGANVLWNTDGGGSIGADTANRPDKLYVATSVNSPLVTMPDNNDGGSNGTNVTVSAGSTLNFTQGGDLLMRPGISDGGAGGSGIPGRVVLQQAYNGDNTFFDILEIGTGGQVSIKTSLGISGANGGLNVTGSGSAIQVNGYHLEPSEFNAGTTTIAAITVDWANGSSQLITAQNSTVALVIGNNGAKGAWYTLRVATGLGNFTGAFSGSNLKWVGAAPAITTTAGRADIFRFYYDGTDYYGSVVGQAYTP